MRRACRPSPAWLRWALPVCAAALLAPRPAVGQCDGPAFATSPFAPGDPGSQPRGLVVGDFYGPGGVLDGNPDAVVTRDADQVRILAGNGNGSFGVSVDTAVGGGPMDLVTGNFDPTVGPNALLDIALIPTGVANTVQLLSGTGLGFAGPSDLAVGVAPSRLAVGDFDRDGLLDLVVVSEAAGELRVYRGDGALGFSLFTSQPTIPVAGDYPTSAAAGDFDQDGIPDLAVTVVTSIGPDQVQVFLGDGTGALGDGAGGSDPFFVIGVGTDPVDVVTGDLTRDGILDLVTADSAGTGTATVLSGDGSGGFNLAQTVGTGLATPGRVDLADFDRDGILDLAVHDDGSDALVVFAGSGGAPAFYEGAPRPPVPVPLGTVSTDLAVSDFDLDGWDDLLAADDGQVTWFPNDASPNCLRTSFLDAPRAFPGGNGPVSVAVADLDKDGLDDLVVAAQFGGSLELLRGTGNGYVPNGSVSPVPIPRGVAAADFDVNGDVDVVVAAGNEVQIFPGNGDGTLGLPSPPVGLGGAALALVVGDFDEDGAPDVAATTQVPAQVHILLGNGLGGLVPGPVLSTGGFPRSLATGHIDGNTTLDIVVGNSALGGGVTILLGNGDGTFTEPLWSPYDTTLAPWGVALADFDGDTLLDLATADHDASRISISKGTGTGDFDPASFLVVTGLPIAIATLDVTADTKNDVMVVTGDHTLALREGNGDLSFQPEVSFPVVRTRPSAIAPVDADADGQPDLAIPCRGGDSVVVLLARPPGFAQAPTVPVGNTPTGVVAGDLDNNGTLDLAVANSADGTVTVLDNDGAGLFTPRLTTPEAVGTLPNSIVVADFDRDGVLDLATSNGNSADVSVLFGVLTPVPDFAPAQNHAVGTAPDDLVVADFNRDGAPDIAVCNKVSPGQVTFLENDGGGNFTLQGPVTLAAGEDDPVSIVSADFDGDGRTDVAVANDASDNVTVLYNDGTWLFPTRETLPLDQGDSSPVSLASGDFDHDGDVDLVAATSGFDKLRLLDNTGAAFTLLATRYESSENPLAVTAADLNRDGRLDVAVAAEGLKVLPGRDGPDFEPSEDVIAGRRPHALMVGDFDRDGRPDVALANELSNDVSILLSSACLPRRVVVSTSPVGCGAVGPLSDSIVSVQDDGGNLAKCAVGDVVASIGAGNPLASLSGDVDVALMSGEATFSTLSIDQPGPRYQLAFDFAPLPTILSRSFTLGATVTFTGPPSICPATFETYTADPGFESYRWFLDGSLTPFDFGPTAVVDAAVGPGTHDLTVEARIDTCAPTDTKSLFVGDLFDVTITPSGPVIVCVNCLGGPVTVTEVGGGTPVLREWGYRPVSGTPPIVPIPGQTGDTYVINGLDFPGPGTYFLVETTTPTCGSPVTSNEIAVTVTAIVPTNEVESLGITSRGAPGSGENILQWMTPGTPDDILVRWNQAPGPSPEICSFPPDPLTPLVDGEQLFLAPPTGRFSWIHDSLALDTEYCYSIFVKVAGSYLPGRTAKARPIDTSVGPVRWTYATGATAIVPPTVAGPGILLASNDLTVHSIDGSILTGVWPLLWTPTSLPGVAHARLPVIPFLLGPVGDKTPSDFVLFAADDTGVVRAIHAGTGQDTWMTDPSLPDSVITGAPGGFFTQWGGPADVVLVGTRDTLPDPDRGVFYTLDVNTGAVLGTFDGGGNLGPILSTPALDYATGRAYFTSRTLGGPEPSVWCVQILPSGAIDPIPVWTQPLGDIDASPVLMNGRVYVGNLAEEVYSLNAASGAPGPPLPTADGPVKGYLFPDLRGNNDLYFATDTTVWSVRDAAGTLTTNWTWRDLPLPGLGIEPSVVLHWPQTNYLYFGSTDGRLVQLDFTSGPPADPCAPPSCEEVILGGGADRIGSPSLDIGVVPPDVSPNKKLLLVGSESGVVHSLEVPLPWP